MSNNRKDENISKCIVCHSCNKFFLTWKDAAGQIKTVVNNVVFPALDMILAIAFFGKTGLAYFDYKKHGQFEWTGPVILFACLILTLIAPNYIWTIIGI